MRVFLVLLTLINTCLAAPLLYQYWRASENPRVVLHTQPLREWYNAKYQGRTVGQYDPRDATIHISLITNSSRSIAYTLLHEYGHYLSYRISDDEHERWNGFCNHTTEYNVVYYHGYGEEHWCSEQFADGLATYILRTPDLPDEQQEFFAVLVHKYVQD